MTRRPLTGDHARQEITFQNEDIQTVERKIARQHQLIDASKLNIRDRQYELWRFEQGIQDDEHVEDAAIEQDILFRVRFPDHKAI